ncbi:NAD(P)/FAD-dependent oxidoreductase [Halocatena pleomorpha]|uniref:NAD(P)/FAD-dependent oxidoreductase n=1 Tax=Halocatena pleomorpha TaxID=1785090 RepID=A0A3P3RH25_9EURY|nr:NAD(P)/FAD-dependent oxidoreductase [Halocatena pleomorpha]RRJ32169.1 NAD(P)/FAD-dependent oxidoreductase [Halocatena pleomorpha]
MIGIVGGGIAGLAAAYRLQRAGHDVQVFEASSDVGGLAATYETSGDRIEAFYHHLSKSEQTIVDLATELGVGDRVEWHVGKNAYYVDGSVYPMDTPWEILSFPHWSVYDKFRLGMLTLDVDVRGGVPSFDTYERLEDFEHVPVKEFAVEHTTQNVYETFFDPLLDAKFGSRKDDVSAAWLLGRIKFRGERDLLRGEVLGYIEGGFGVLLDALVAAVGKENITTDARVTDLAVKKEVQSLTVETEGETTTHDVEDVIIATMPNVLESLTGYPCEIDFQGSVCAVLEMDESLMDTYWLNVADDAPFGALIEHTNFIPTDRYGGEHLLYVASYIQDQSEDLWQMSDEQVTEHWLSGIEELFPQFDRDAVTNVRIARNPRTAPIYERGYLDMVVPYDLGAEVGDGIYYAGMASQAQYPERSLNGGILAGYACADRIIEADDTESERVDPLEA